MGSSTPAKRKLAYIYLIATTSIWGSLYVVTRIVLASLAPFTLLFFRYFIAAIALGIVIKTRGTRTGKTVIEKGDYRYLFFIGIVGYCLSVGAQIFGTKYAGASVASLINSMNPVCIILFAVLILRERLTVNKVIAVAAAVTGAYIILGGAGPGGAAIGVVLSVVSVLFWALSSVFARRVMQKYDPVVFTTLGIVIAMACTLPAAAIEMATVPHGEIFTLTNVLCLLYLGVVCTALPNVLWNKSLSMIEASTCSLFYPIQPLVSVLMGILILGERLDLKFVIGAILIIGGVFYAVLTGKGDR
jgi:drug/metabolite transporter (DMT)-like permease